MSAAEVQHSVEQVRARIAAIQAEFDPQRAERGQSAVYRRWNHARCAGALALRMAGHNPVWIAAKLQVQPRDMKRHLASAVRLSREDDAFNDMLSEIRAAIGNAPPPAPPSDGVAAKDWREVVNALLAAQAITWAELTGSCRVRRLARVRHLIMAVLVARGNSRAQVARWIGRDHSSVIHGVRVFADHAARPEGAAMLALFRLHAPDGVEPADLVRVVPV